MTDLYNIQDLVKLFNPPRDNDDSDSDSNDNFETNQNEAGSSETKASPYSKLESAQKEPNPDDVDLETEVSYCEPSSDWKKTPKWDITYRQKVTACDVFLQMGAKTPSTASCEDMIITMHLPGEHMQNMDIKVHPNSLDVSSPNFSVEIPLPQPVHPQKGDAKWDKDQENLIINLRMEREFDFINF